MQQLARRHSQKIIDENQKLRSEIETKMNELDELAAKSGYDRRNLEQEKQKVCDFSTFSSYPLFNRMERVDFLSVLLVCTSR
jgi:Skp family chaperone for outer membrane proteins